MKKYISANTQSEKYKIYKMLQKIANELNELSGLTTEVSDSQDVLNYERYDDTRGSVQVEVRQVPQYEVYNTEGDLIIKTSSFLDLESHLELYLDDDINK